MTPRASSWTPCQRLAVAISGTPRQGRLQVGVFTVRSRLHFWDTGSQDFFDERPTREHQGFQARPPHARAPLLVSPVVSRKVTHSS